MPAQHRREDEPEDDLEARIGRTLAETERLNSPEHRAGEQARGAVRRRRALAGRGARRRAFNLALLILLALIGLIGWLTWLSAS